MNKKTISNIIINIKSFGIILDYLMYCKNKVFLENKDPFDLIIQSIQVCKHVFSLLGTEFKIEEEQQPKQKKDEKKDKQEARDGEEQRIEKEKIEEERLKREPEKNKLKDDQPQQKEKEEKKEIQEPKEEEEKFYKYFMKLHKFSSDKRIFKELKIFFNKHPKYKFCTIPTDIYIAIYFNNIKYLENNIGIKDEILESYIPYNVILSGHITYNMFIYQKHSVNENFEGTSLGTFIRGLALSNLSDKTVSDMIYWGPKVSVYCTKMKDLCRARYKYWKAIKDFFVNEPNKSIQSFIQSFKELREDKIQSYIVQFYFMVHRNSKDFSLTQLFTLKFDNDNNKYDYILNSYLEFAISKYQKIDIETIVYQIQQILNEKNKQSNIKKDEITKKIQNTEMKKQNSIFQKVGQKVIRLIF